jgi:hypothetical protein
MWNNSKNLETSLRIVMGLQLLRETFAFFKNRKNWGLLPELGKVL